MGSKKPMPEFVVAPKIEMGVLSVSKGHEKRQHMATRRMVSEDDFFTGIPSSDLDTSGSFLTGIRVKIWSMGWD